MNLILRRGQCQGKDKNDCQVCRLASGSTTNVLYKSLNISFYLRHHQSNSISPKGRMNVRNIFYGNSNKDLSKKHNCQPNVKARGKVNREFIFGEPRMFCHHQLDDGHFTGKN